MTNEEFAALVDRLEVSARRRPAVYRWRVLLLAMLGNAYLLFVLLFITALFLASLISVIFLKALAIKIIIPVGIFLWVVLKSLMVKFSPPQGVRVRRKEAPDLFSLIDELRRHARAPRFHQVLIDESFNAAVVQRPRLGVFGWYSNYLLIGLPLMKMLSVEQFTAVLAHEFGHLAKGHGRLSNWIYRQRLRWAQLMRLFGDEGYRGSFLFTPFLNRFAPYFNAYSFPLARANEYEADAAAAKVTSASAAAEALTAAYVAASYLDGHYWPQIYRQADDTPQPAFAPYREMHGELARKVTPSVIHEWIDQAMARQTDLADTHPSLSDRLRALGEEPRFAPPSKEQSADQLLGPSLARLTEHFDQGWAAATAEGWRRRYEEVKQGREALATLERKASDGEELTLQEAFDRAKLIERYGAGADAALIQFEALHKQAPEDVVLCYALGVRRLSRHDESGVTLVRYAMNNDIQAFVPGAEVLRDYYWRIGNHDEAHRWHELMVERAENDRLAANERNEVRLKDKFERHGLNEDEIAVLRAQLKKIPGLRKAYVVRKRVERYPERPLFIVGFTIRLAVHTHRLRAEVQKRILKEVSLPGETLVFSVEGKNYRFGRKFRWMRGSRVL